MDLEKKKVDTESNNAEKWIMHYGSSQKILLVGEGDFSFSACLATAFGSAANMVATSLDSREMLRKYSRAMSNLTVLEVRGCTILNGVDACSMSQHDLLKAKLFDRIVFNFPHAGVFRSESSSWTIQLHQDLVKNFLRNAFKMLTENGEVHITHKTAHPFCNWEIQKLGVEVGLAFLSEVPFYLHSYPGYVNKRGKGYRCNESFPVGICSTFKFGKYLTL